MALGPQAAIAAQLAAEITLLVLQSYREDRDLTDDEIRQIRDRRHEAEQRFDEVTSEFLAQE
jgi:hypothetical protein